MQTIYQYNKDFDKSEIINKMNDLSEQIKEEQTKDNDEYNKEKELELIYVQLIQGIKLSVF